MSSTTTSLSKVTVFGTGGTTIGHHLVKALVAKPGSFEVEIIARKSSKSNFQQGVRVHYVDDDMLHEQLVKALQGQDVLISAIGFRAIELETKLIDAAIEARVKRFLPSEYGINNTNPSARALSPVYDAKGEVIEYLKTKESTGLAWTAVPTGLWLDWSLEPAESFADINILNHTAKLWANGTHSLSWSTLSWAANSITQILLSPELTANKVVPIRGFEASQNQIVAALEKVQDTKYEITHFDAEDVIAKSKKSWTENKDIASALQLAKAGLFLDGYGSNLVSEGITQIGNEFLELPPLDYEEVVEEALRRWT